MSVEYGHAGSALLTAEQVAELLNISERSVWRHLSAGKFLEPVRIGGCVRWVRERVLRWIEEGCPTPKGT
jgi:excisionase family DNA binding protein